MGRKIQPKKKGLQKESEEPMNAQNGRPIVIGSGIAGLSVALALSKAGAVPLVVTAKKLGFGSSAEARGGIAAALAKTDSAAAHAEDTIAVGGGLCSAGIVGQITAEGALAIRDLHALGVAFDEDPKEHLLFSLGKEAGHRVHRIVHAKGDATGKEIMRALQEAARTAIQKNSMECLEDCEVTQLLRDKQGVFGVAVVDKEGFSRDLLGSEIVLATGGLGGLYRKTTNPGRSCGIGIALASEAGASLADLEFVQFHPTALDVTRAKTDTSALPLLSEALRGAGATLLDPDGERFMLGEHFAAELAPRDVVARSVSRTIREKGGAFLDARHFDVERRFPAAWHSARAAGFDPAREVLPVVPAHHFHMGGVTTDVHGKTNVSGLWAVGEVARTGFHGANRLASNSLLEGWVMGQHCAAAMLKNGGCRRQRRPLSKAKTEQMLVSAPKDSQWQNQPSFCNLQDLMEEKMGVLRSGPSLASALQELENMSGHFSCRQEHNTHLVATLMCRAALDRTTSCGAHHREDSAPYTRRSASQDMASQAAKKNEDGLRETKVA